MIYLSKLVAVKVIALAYNKFNLVFLFLGESTSAEHDYRKQCLSAPALKSVTYNHNMLTTFSRQKAFHRDLRYHILIFQGNICAYHFGVWRHRFQDG